MRKRRVPRLFTVAATVVLSLCGACADDGTVPAVEPEPEPFLTVSPDTLFYDLSGNPLDASEFAVKTNCAWRLSVPEQADWFEASATSGQCDASVSFQLGTDVHYRVAELVFAAIAADGKPVVSRSVFIQQGEKPADPSNPDDPSDPNTPDNPDEKPGGDPSEPSDPGDGPTDPSNPDNPSDPDKNPDNPPETPAIPKIESVTPSELLWTATDSGVIRQVAVTVKDFDNHVLQEPRISGADAGRFEASVNGLVVSVKTVGTNETDADYRASLEISVAEGNSVSVPLVQSKRESVPDSGNSGGNSGDNSGNSGNNSGGDNSGDNSGSGSGDGNGEPDVPKGGGSDDFAMLKATSQPTDLETPSGWKGFDCAVYSGDNGNDTAPYFRSLLGCSPDVKGLAMYTAGGRIESPELHGGCGTLTFRYGVTEPDKRVDFTVEILRNGTRVKSWPVGGPVTQYKQNEFSADVQFSGDFQIVIRNNASSTAEYTTVFQIAWSGYPAD